MASQKREQAPALQGRLSPARGEDKSRSLALLGMTNHESQVTSHESRLPPAGRRRPLQGGEGGEFGVGGGFLLEENLEAFAHAFGEDERFELQARADTVGFIHAVVVEVGELVSLP